MSVNAAFQHAHALHAEGRLDEAMQLYRAIIQAAPRHADSHHYLGVALLQSGDAAAAVEQIGKAIRLNPKDAETYANLAGAYRGLGKLDDAARAYARAIAAKPGFAEAYFHRGVVLRDLDRGDEALSSFARAIALQPNYAEAHLERGVTLERAGLIEDAVAAYRQAEAIRPDWADATYNCGNALKVLRQFELAEASFSRALEFRPDLAQAWNNRGICRMNLGRLEASLDDHLAAIRLDPSDDHFRINLCWPLMALGRFEDAAEIHEDVLGRDPRNARAHLSRGFLFEERGDPASALAEYELARALDPDLRDARWNCALVLLKTGHWAKGWEEHETRLRAPGASRSHEFRQPLWGGEADIAGKTLFLHWEQGFGDTIQFARFARSAEERGASVVLSVQNPLTRLMRSLSPGVTILGADETPERFDLHTPILSLARAFGVTVDSIPSFDSYLTADPDDVARWRLRFPRTGRPRVGLAWSGNPTHLNDHNRSLPLARLLAALPDQLDYFCVQKEITPADQALLAEDGRVQVVTDQFGDFADTAALVETLDLVITVDTSLAHLSGALGRPVWVLLPFNPDWRWLLGRDDSPWYPSARLFRQPRFAEWDSVLAEVSTALRDQAFGQELA